LTLAGAKVTRIVVAGAEEPLALFQFDAAHVRYTQQAPDPVPDAAAKITLEKRLVPIDTPIIVAVIGLLGTISTGWVAYQTGMDKKTATVSPAASASASASGSAGPTSTVDSGPPVPTQPISHVNIAFPRGYHAIVGWSGGPTEFTGRALAKDGVRTDDVELGVREVYSAMAKRTRCVRDVGMAVHGRGQEATAVG
jgi:hypothetical protein